MENKITHIHFGAGNLGIGLVLPAISENVRLAVVQNDSLGNVSSSGNITISNSKEYSQAMSIVTDDSSEEYKSKIFEDWLEKGNKPLFIYSKDWERYSSIIVKADSISCALKDGQENLSTLLSKSDFPYKPQVYPFENTLSDELAKNSKIAIVKVVSDRICVDRSKIKNNKLSVKAEEKGLIVINSEDEKTLQVFHNSRKIDVKFKTGHSFNYYNERKMYLINGLHFTMATFGYSLLIEARVPVKHWETQYLPLIQRILRLKVSGYSAHIENYIDGHIIRLILKYRDIIQKEHNVQNNEEDLFDILRSYYEEVLIRFEKPDTLSRILNYDDPLGVVKKYRKFLDEVKIFTKSHKREIDNLPIRTRPFSEDINESLDLLIRLVTEVNAEASEYKKKQLEELEELTAITKAN